MPTCRRKRVVLTEPSDALLEAVKTNPTKDVFYLEQTGEIFEDYEVGVPTRPGHAFSSDLPGLYRPHVFLSSETISM